MSYMLLTFIMKSLVSTCFVMYGLSPSLLITDKTHFVSMCQFQIKIFYHCCFIKLCLKSKLAHIHRVDVTPQSHIEPKQD